MDAEVKVIPQKQREDKPRPISTDNTPSPQTTSLTADITPIPHLTTADISHAHHILIKNRRKIYLERNPQYFTSPDLELVDPLQYDRYIRRFQSAAEREADGRSKGWSGVLEADLYRSEAKIAAVKNAYAKSGLGELGSESVGDDRHRDDNDDDDGDEDEMGDAPTSKEEGLERWKYEMTMRFLNGLDSDFEYKEVDENEEFDEIEIREAQERWFEDEEPEWNGDVGSSGETGIQDF